MPPNIDRLIRLKTEHRDKIKAAEELLETARRENRALSRTERTRIEGLYRELDVLAGEIRAANGGDFDPRRAQGDTDDPPETTADVLSRDQRMVDWVRERRGGHPSDYERGEFSLGRILTALVRRDRSNLTDLEKRALIEGTDASGGFLTPEVLAAQVIDRLRAKGKTFQAGVQVIPMTSNELNFGRLTGGVTPTWKTEAAAISDQSMTFDRVTLRPQTLPLLVKISQELFDDLSSSAATVIEEEMLGALALELDRVILRGSGSLPEPKGILNQTSVGLQVLATNGQTLNGYTDFGTAIGTVRAANLEPTAAIINAKTQAALDLMKDSTGQPLRAPSSVANLPFLISNVVPSNTVQGTSGAVCSEAYVAQWDQVLVGMRTDVRVAIRPLMERYADNLMVGLLVYLRADVALRHGEAAVVLQGIKTTA